MKDRVKLKKIISFLVPILLISVFILSLLPILQLAKYDFASGDDYGYGLRPHAAWTATGSLWEVIKSLGVTVRIYYYSWQGTWSTIVLMALQPEVFSPKAYWVTPWIMSLVITVTTTLLVRTLNRIYLKWPLWSWISADILILLAMFQCFPSTKSALFWYNGCAHYILPYGMAMLALVGIFEYRQYRTRRHLILAGIMMTLLGGASYQVPLLVIIVLVYLWVIDAIKKTNKHIWWLAIPFVLEVTGLVISYKAPGNILRAEVQNGSDLSFSAKTIVYTVLQSFREAFVTAFDYLKQSPFVFICLVGIGIISAYVMITVPEFVEDSDAKFRFPMPGLVVAFSFCIYAAMFSPGVFSQALLSGGVPNTDFQAFILTTAVSIVYVIGWVANRKGFAERNSETNAGKSFICHMGIYGAVLIFCLIWIVAARHTIKNTTAYVCYEYLHSGRAEDYRSQIQYNYNLLLDDSLEECTALCPINDDQGPLMHMPVVNDRDAFTNRVVREFFGKKKIEVDHSLNISASD